MTFMLSQQELKELTGHSRSDAQARELKFMGIEHKIRRDGSVAVSKDHCESVLSGDKRHLRKAKNDEKINWDAASA